MWLLTGHAFAATQILANGHVGGNAGTPDNHSTNIISATNAPMEDGVSSFSSGSLPAVGGTTESTSAAWAHAEVGRLRFQAHGTTAATVTAGGGAYMSANCFSEAQASWSDTVTVSADPSLLGHVGEMTVDLVVEGDLKLSSRQIDSLAQFYVIVQFLNTSLTKGKQLRRVVDGVVTEAPGNILFAEPGIWTLTLQFNFGWPGTVRVLGEANATGLDYASISTGMAQFGEAASDFGSGVRWAGIRSVRVVGGGAVTNYTVQSASGYDYISGTTSNLPPSNDSFAARRILRGMRDFVLTDNTLATTEPGEPEIGGAAAEHTVWHQWTAPESGTYLFGAAAASFRPRISVFTNSSPTNVVTLATLESVTDLAAGVRPGEIAFNADAGTTYLTAVGGSDGHVDVVYLVLNALRPPANDNFTNRIPIINRSWASLGNNRMATKEPGEPRHSQFGAGRTVWWSWKAPTNSNPEQPVTIHTSGSDFKTALAVYTGSSLTNLVLVRANESDPLGGYTSRVTWIPQPGVSYQIAVDGRTNTCDPSDGQCPLAMFGNIMLTVDYSTVDLSVTLLYFEDLFDNSTYFEATLQAHNYGLAPTGPLRVSVVAVGGDDESVAFKLAADLRWNVGGDIIAPIALNSLAPGAVVSSNVSGFIPAPINCIHVWSAYALLEEQIGPDWRPIDVGLLLHGLKDNQSVYPSGFRSLCYAVTTGVLVPNVMPRSGEAELAFLTSTLPNLIPSASRLDFQVHGQMNDDTVVTVAARGMVWTPPSLISVLAVDPLSDTTNCTVLTPEVPGRLSSSLTGRFPFGGFWFTNKIATTIYPRARLSINNLTNGLPQLQRVELQLLGDASHRYAVERTLDLGQTNWSPLQGTQTFSGTILKWTNTLTGPPTNYFYRSRELP